VTNHIVILSQRELSTADVGRLPTRRRPAERTVYHLLMCLGEALPLNTHGDRSDAEVAAGIARSGRRLREQGLDVNVAILRRDPVAGLKDLVDTRNCREVVMFLDPARQRNGGYRAAQELIGADQLRIIEHGAAA
jgi:hypothetical protein